MLALPCYSSHGNTIIVIFSSLFYSSVSELSLWPIVFVQNTELYILLEDLLGIKKWSQKHGGFPHVQKIVILEYIDTKELDPEISPTRTD
jgi:hypothetical protein